MDKYRQLAYEDMKNKSISAVAGTSPTMVRELKNKGIKMVEDLYVKLKEFDFKDEKFYEWMPNVVGKENLVKKIYKDLIKWGEHHDGLKTSDINKGSENPQTSSMCDGANEPQAGAKRARRISPKRDSARFDGDYSNHPLMLYLRSLSHKIEEIPSEFHLEFMSELIQILIKIKRNASLPETRRLN